jgi:hypothetical protein
MLNMNASQLTPLVWSDYMVVQAYLALHWWQRPITYVQVRLINIKVNLSIQRDCHSTNNYVDSI